MQPFSDGKKVQNSDGLGDEFEFSLYSSFLRVYLSILCSKLEASDDVFRLILHLHSCYHLVNKGCWLNINVTIPAHVEPNGPRSSLQKWFNKLEIYRPMPTSTSEIALSNLEVLQSIHLKEILPESSFLGYLELALTPFIMTQPKCNLVDLDHHFKSGFQVEDLYTYLPFYIVDLPNNYLNVGISSHISGFYN